MRDPLGGIKGDEIKKSNPFAVDRLNALKELDTSIDWIEGRKRKSDKTVLQRMRGWLRSIDAEKPDLSDPVVTKCYEATKLRTRPGRYMKVEPELLPMD